MQKMIGKMARMYPMLIALGFMIVLAAFIVGYLNSQTADVYFAATKAVRETSLLAERASIESTGLWMPPFKFLGLGLILGGIVMALRVIIDNLIGAGQEVLTNVPEGNRPVLPAPPWYGKLMPMVMMVGEMIFVGAFGIGLWLSGIARDLFSNPLSVLDGAGSGSSILAGIQTIHAVEGWLIPFKFFGIATEFLAITMGLATIIFILKAQTRMLDNILGNGSAQ